jgi:hypothetical protein
VLEVVAAAERKDVANGADERQREALERFIRSHNGCTPVTIWSTQRADRHVHVGREEDVRA